MAFQLGQRAGDYEFIDLIDSSKKDICYKVRNVLVHRFEVLRVLPKTLQDDQDKVTRFLREAKVHARINHPNIVTFYHATQVQGQLVMTTELVEGATLADRLELGPLPVEQALGYASQLLAALAHAHSLGVVHRDITPSNIVLTPDGSVKLTGFGLAKATTDPQLTQPGTVMGNLDYISPEQIKGITELDARTDIYSLGVVLYEAVTGRKPFAQKSQFEVMLAHVNTVPQAPSAVNPAVPSALSEIIMKALAKEPQARFQSAEEFQRQVDQLRSVTHPPVLAATQPVPVVAALPALPPEAAVPPSAPAPAQASSWRLVAAGVITFVVVVLVFFAMARRF